jgi:hypothetical protein
MLREWRSAQSRLPAKISKGSAEAALRRSDRADSEVLRSSPQATRNCFLIKVQSALARARLPRARLMILSAWAWEMACLRAK